MWIIVQWPAAIFSFIFWFGFEQIQGSDQWLNPFIIEIIPGNYSFPAGW